MIKILFVCHGNICRSTMAEMYFKYLVHQNNLSHAFYINSAGTSREEIGNGVHYGTKSILAQKGIPCENHRAVQMTKKDYEAYDYLIAMDHANVRNILRIVGGDPDDKVKLLLSYAGREDSIADPWYTGDFNETYRDVEEGCNALLQYIQSQARVD